MQNFISAPHRGGTGAPSSAPNAALLIDFDNVTMGIRSDLTRQLKELLNSDIIRGKVAVQRAYADWRRYAQYIVPLSEASVDLIFAPAYGSSKKNATDIRLAIDALELVFTRPEIGVYILLSGDSDFSSLVLKLKEYGKYVIGVGLRESASDLLVQNCDEYYSYSSLTGLTKAGEEDVVSEVDPWELTERAVRQMADDDDVMRSDRLKQVMLEMDPNFDESKIGFSKFNKFLVEAASRNKLGLRKLDNGQYEVQPYENGGGEVRDDRRRGRGGRDRQEEAQPQPPQRREAAVAAAEPATRPAPSPQATPAPRRERTAAEKPKPRPSTRDRRAETLEQSYELLRRAVRELIEGGAGAARDSDIKRQMLDIQSGWDESELGFTKFSRFLRQAHDAEAIDLSRSAEGFYEARLPRGGAPGRERDSDRSRRDRPREPRRETQAAGAPGEERAEAERRPRREERAERPEREPRGGEPRTAPKVDEPAARSTEAEVKAEPKPEPKPERKPEPRAEAKAAEAETKAAETDSPEPETPRAEEAAAPEAATPAGGAATGRAPRTRGGRRGRRGAPEGPPPVLPGQAVGPKSGNGGRTDKPAETPGATVAETGATADAPAKQAERKQRTPKAETPKSEAPKSEAPKSEAPKVEAEDAPGMESVAPGASSAEAPPSEAGEPERSKAPATRPERKRPEARKEEAAQLAFESGGEPAQPAPGAGDDFDPDAIGLPTDEGAVIRYLSNSYQGVGQKTAEALIEAFGASRVFNGLHSQPERVKEVLGTGRRTEALLGAWLRDYRRRTTGGAAGSPGAGAADES